MAGASLHSPKTSGCGLGVPDGVATPDMLLLVWVEVEVDTAFGSSSGETHENNAMDNINRNLGYNRAGGKLTIMI